jgi:hypothetical protein
MKRFLNSIETIEAWQGPKALPLIDEKDTRSTLQAI